MNSLTVNPAHPQPDRLRRFATFVVMNPVTRVIVGFVLIGGCAAALQALLPPSRLRTDQPLSPTSLGIDWIVALVSAALFLAVYSLFVRLFEKRWPREVSLTQLWYWLPLGFVRGAALISASAVLLQICGLYIVQGVAPSSTWTGLVLRALATSLVVACFEEILLRGIFFRIVEASLGSWLALAISAIVFGLLHLGNPNATWVAALGLSLQAGVLLGAAYMANRSLWVPIGLHWAWNGIQAGVFGGALSGNAVQAIFTSSPAGPDWLSGGDFGIEGSVIATSLCALVGCAFCVAAVRGQKIQPPFWASRAAISPVG